jgi:hypothetical protein
VEEWKSGRVEEWKSGRVEEWKSGRVAEWQSGRVAEWQSGRMVERFISGSRPPLLPFIELWIFDGEHATYRLYRSRFIHSSSEAQISFFFLVFFVDDNGVYSIVTLSFAKEGKGKGKGKGKGGESAGLRKMPHV